MRYLVALIFLAHGATVWANDTGYFGLLRARDLTPFGYLRLDMRPAHAISGPAGTWGVEAEIAYQNTWALSPHVEQYLTSLPRRRNLGAADVAAIRALPGENYLLDLELAQVDVTFHYKFAKYWGTYLTFSGASYNGGFLDSGIEGFHHTFGFSTFGRKAVKRNDVNAIFDLKSVQSARFDIPEGGLLDPTLGIRYSGARLARNWNLVLEAAVKVPVLGRREYLSTGHEDYGLQASLQRFSKHHAFYIDVAAVYFQGSTEPTPTQTQVIPTLIVGYERRLNDRTHLIGQAYASPSVYTRKETDLHELLATKFQFSFGVYHRIGRGLISFAATENLQNLNNTPDIGFQLGWAYSPALAPTPPAN